MEDGENPPIGIILCSEKNETHVEYALGGLNNLHLPKAEDLEVFVQRTRRRLEELIQ